MSKINLTLKVLLYSIPFLILSSCVNPDYDLTKDIVTDATFFENVSLPVGNVEKITIESLMLSDTEGTGIECDANGDYHVEFTSGEIATEIEVPTLSLDGVTFEDQIININLPPQFVGSSSSLPEFTLTYSDLNGGKPLELDMDIEFDTELPYQVVDIDQVELDASLACHFTLNIGKIHVLKGFTLTFPEYIYLSECEGASNYEIIDNHVLRFTEDVEFGADAPLTVSFSFDKVTVPDEMIIHNEDAPDRLATLDYIHVSGDFFLESTDFATIPEALQIIMNMEVESLNVVSADVCLEYDIQIPDEDIVLDELPELLQGGDITIDLYNPLLFVKANNTSPFDFSIDAYVTAFRGSESSDIYIGKNDEPLYVYAESTRDYYFSRREMTVPEGADNIVIPEIGDLIKNIPDRLRIHDINVTSTNEMQHVIAGEVYNADMKYYMKAPLAFGENLRLSFTQDIEDLNLQFDLDIPSAEVSMVMVNSIPADFAISAICLDENGNEIPETTVKLDKVIAAGSQHNPVETPLKLTIENKLETFNVSSLRLTLVASANEDPSFHGICLNKNQGFEIKDVIVTLPDGIGYEFEFNIM